MRGRDRRADERPPPRGPRLLRLQPGRRALHAGRGDEAPGRPRAGRAGRAWDDVAQARAELGPLLDRIRPRTIGWYAGSSPAGAYASILRARPGSTELTGSRVSEISMEFASIVQARRVLHGGEPVLDAHVATATRLTTSDGWRYGRKGHDPVDALYAVSGAASLALAQPLPARATIRILSAR